MRGHIHQPDINQRVLGDRAFLVFALPISEFATTAVLAEGVESRFKHPLGTSSALVGAFINKKLHRLEDADGISWLEALDDAGFDVKEKDIEALLIKPVEVTACLTNNHGEDMGCLNLSNFFFPWLLCVSFFFF